MKAKKSLGQNFLNSKKIVSRIVDFANISETDMVIEIGPGRGILTSELLNKSGKVLSIEKDDRLILELNSKFSNEVSNGKLVIINDDALNFNLDEKIKSKYKVVANIPYYITGQIIRKLFETKNQPESITLLVQKEVAERLVATDKKESLLSLSVKIYGEPKYCFTINKSFFTPSPKVDSALIHIDKISRKKLVDINEESYFDILHAGFSHKRKQLVSNLCMLYEREKIESVFNSLNIDQKIRAEDLSVESWMEIVKKLSRGYSGIKEI